ncbi:aromatic ring-hydroxylating oxygenase subunit alpha [Ilumatobacter sp.]|uniref:aromatic ring-hydroxylating oxygenase subunit alpha n=1 Tax=Ilumatobacter sp. TaxID=1967498 RepID=UPI003B524989
MDDALVERIRSDMEYEFARTAPPEGFPAFHDIPTARHTTEEFHRIEAEHLWPRTWVIAGRAEQIPDPGDFFTFDDLGVPLLVVRGTDGEVNCFYNTCQHRGAPVVRGTTGSSRRLRCQYHSWTYEIDGGTLVSVPDERDFVGLDLTERCLPRARCDTYAGFVFVNRDLDAPDLSDWIGPAREMLDPFDGGALREVYRESRVIPCNWKVTAEAFLEVYHFRHIHSHDGVSVLDNRGAAMGLYPNGHSRMITPYSKQNVDRSGMGSWDDWEHLDTAPMPAIGGVPAMVDCTSTAVSLFPNVIIPLGRIGFPINVFWPIDAGTTRLDWIYYAPPPDGADRFDPDDLPDHWRTRRAAYDQIMAEDEMNMGPMQSSMESPALTGMPINYQERRIWHLHEQIDRIIGVENIPAEMRVEQLLEPYVER